MPRLPQDRTSAQERTHRRRQALASMDIATLRAWLDEEGFGALGDDAMVLQAAHEARAIDGATLAFLRRASVRWLREHAPDSVALLTERQLVAALRKKRR